MAVGSLLEKLPLAFQEETESFLKEEYPDFINALTEETPIAIHLNSKIDFSSTNTIVPWYNRGVYLKQRPQFTLDPLWHNGAYYVQEASSMFLSTVIKQY